MSNNNSTRDGKGRFLPGNEPGPGRGKGNSRLKSISQNTRLELSVEMSKVLKMPVKELAELAGKIKEFESDYPSLTAVVVIAFARYFKSGDVKGFEYLLNQVIGRPRESVDLNALVEVSNEYSEQRKQITDLIDNIEKDKKKDGSKSNK